VVIFSALKLSSSEGAGKFGVGGGDDAMDNQSHTCVERSSDGSLACFGSDLSNQLGHGTTVVRYNANHFTFKVSKHLP
jgi:hypothetical protein